MDFINRYLTRTKENSKELMIPTPLKLPCGAVIPNRIGKSAMTEQLSDYNANPTPQMINLYREWGTGGSGLIITGNIMVNRRCKEGPYNLVLDENSDLQAFREMAMAAQEQGGQCWAQLSHAGRQAMRSSSSAAICPSNTPMYSGEGSSFWIRWISKLFFVPVREMVTWEIGEVIDQFVMGAILAKDAGFSGVQFHSAHGYLLSQFLSPNINLREDDWGGSLENRSRLLLTIVDRTRAAVGPDFAISVKLNSSDFTRNGFSYEESAALIRELGEHSVDLVEISGGNYESLTFMTGRAGNEGGSEEGDEEPSSLRRGDAYFRDFAEELEMNEINVPIMLTGGFRNMEAMESALHQGLCQMVGLARPLAQDPHYANRILSSYSVETARLPELPAFPVPSLLKGSYFGHLLKSSLSLSYYLFQIRQCSKGKGGEELGSFGKYRKLAYYIIALYLPRPAFMRPY